MFFIQPTDAVGVSDERYETRRYAVFPRRLITGQVVKTFDKRIVQLALNRVGHPPWLDSAAHIALGVPIL